MALPLSAIDSASLTPEARKLTASVPQRPPHTKSAGSRTPPSSTQPTNPRPRLGSVFLAAHAASRFAASGASGASDSPSSNADDFVLCVFAIAVVAAVSAHVCFLPAWVGISAAVGWAMWGTTLTLTALIALLLARRGDRNFRDSQRTNVKIPKGKRASSKVVPAGPATKPQDTAALASLGSLKEDNSFDARWEAMMDRPAVYEIEPPASYSLLVSAAAGLAATAARRRG